MRNLLLRFGIIISAFVMFGCSEEPKETSGDSSGDSLFNISTAITPYSGTWASDSRYDRPTNNTDFYWEASEFPNKVNIVYDGVAATATCDNPNVKIHITGANVTVDARTDNVAGVEIVAKGKSDDGQLKIYGTSRTLLTLDGLQLKSLTGPAINNQNKKRLMVHLTDKSENRVEDAAAYSADSYYLPGENVDSEDRKGCFFSEGHLILSGTGRLIVKGNNRHGVVTDGYFYMRPGVTLVIEDAPRNALHVKGDLSEGIGIMITGGYLYACTTGESGRAIRCDLDVDIAGGVLSLNSSGSSVFDPVDNDLSSPAGIKAGGNVNIHGSDLSIKVTGDGGKGINATGNIYITDCKLTVAVSGQEYIDTQRGLSASPKGVKADEKVMITGGDNTIYATGDGVSGASMEVNGGTTTVLSIDKDGIDVNGTFLMREGTLISIGDGGNSSGVESAEIVLNGGILYCSGGTQSEPAAGSAAWAVTTLNNAKSGEVLSFVQSNNEETRFSFTVARSQSAITILVSSEKWEKDVPVRLTRNNGSMMDISCR